MLRRALPVVPLLRRAGAAFGGTMLRCYGPQHRAPAPAASSCAAVRMAADGPASSHSLQP